MDKGNSMIKVAVVGSGYWGKNLIRNFHNIGALGAICDKDPRILSKFQDLYQEIPGIEGFERLMKEFEPNVDAIVIATPAASHYSLAKESLRAGKHVFVEKPLSLTEEEGKELVELANQKQVTLMVGHILQYHPAVLKLKELIDAGELGKIQYLYSNRLNIGKIRTEENILWSFAPHDISVILWLLEEMPQTVYASGGNFLQSYIPDTTLTNLDFPSGVKAHIFVSWLHPFKEQKLVVVGDKKMAVFDDVGQEKLTLYPHKIHWMQRVPIAAKAEAEVVEVEKGEPLQEECRHFLECIATGATPRTDGWEGLRVLQVLQASQKSLNQNGSKIRLRSNGGRILQGIAPSERINLREGHRQTRAQMRVSNNHLFVHETSHIDEGVEIGIGSKIWHFSHVLKGSRIGDNCTIGQNVVIGPDAAVGNGCKIQNNVSIYKGVTLEDEVFCGPSMVFTNVYNPRAHIRRMEEIRPTHVKKGATLGANCTIVCGHVIGSYAFIGAGAVITSDVPDYALMFGNPARQKGWMCSCGVPLVFNENKATCQICGKEYKKLENKTVKES
jgi:UDP-2-acetamido-3-amino-2,3-dideoxy-glucuronate N-acetyltransferase